MISDSLYQNVAPALIMLRVALGRAHPHTTWNGNEPPTIQFGSAPDGRSLRNTIITISQSHHDSIRSRDEDLESGDGSFDGDMQAK